MIRLCWNLSDHSPVIEYLFPGASAPWLHQEAISKIEKLGLDLDGCQISNVPGQVTLKRHFPNINEIIIDGTEKLV